MTSERTYGGRSVSDRAAERRQRFLDAALVEFTADVTDPTLFPPSFGDALAASLAAAIAMPITRDGAKQQAAQEHAAVLLEQALVNDANNRPIIPQVYVPPSLAVRGVGMMHLNSLPPVIYPDEVF